MFDKKSYEPSQFEDDIYKYWLGKNYFHAEVDKNKKPFCIIMPPPNVTSQAHIGHALDCTYQDILTRFKRMQGYSALWLPGSDHAAIATESKIVAKLAKEGKTKEMIGRAAFDKEAWDWYNYYGDRIMNQFKKMGFSADWQRYRFTMDPQSTKAVLEAFIRLYNKGYIYRGTRQTHWCTTCKSVISDDEVEFSDEAGFMWHIRYPYADGSGAITVATTRPETLFGDTAVAVNPNDKRYKKIVGKMLKLPLTDREIPIIADDYVESDFGTGMVKITPAHDPNDYLVGQRHNLDFIQVIDKEGKITDVAGRRYAGLSIAEARQKVEDDLKEAGLLEKKEPYKHNVGHCYRCGTAIEPMLTEQWFVKMSELVKPAIKVVKEGELKIHPKRFEKNYFHWLENIQDWCISRQIWTGHRIPIYYCDKCHKPIASAEMPKSCACGCTSFSQDPDVLDTWFSSALWPFSTLGWPEKTAELEYFYPTSVLVTAYDILTQWATKMVYMGFECAGATPFKNCLIHGLVRDELGRKMSKSLGNGIDPLEVVSTHGADALRIALVKDMAMGMDSRFSMQKVDNAKGFINKIWNASKFVALHSKDTELLDISKAKKEAKDKWILTKLSKLIKVVTGNLEKFDAGVALNNIYNFAWNDFCDWYIELCKPSIYRGGEDKQNTVSVLSYVFENLLKILHPYIPYVTEYIYQNMNFADKKTESIMVAEYPKTFSVKAYEEDYALEEKLIETIKLIRNVKTESKIASNVKVDVFFANIKELGTNKDEIEKLALVNLTEEKGEGKIIYTPLGEFVLLDEKKDKAELVKELEAQIDKVKFEVERSEKMLSNPRFVEKAPAALVESEKAKLAENKKSLETLLSKLKNLK
ncbi:MAG: valine--tRNA ligase [Clostridia bacterium]|nr:valine--tRNA ligase [Clostridia bacterium]